MKFNYFKVRNLVRIHKQIEFRDGHVFMRAKKRPLMFISKAN